MDVKGVIGICGCGFIGRGWAMLYASAGYKVKLFDKNKFQIKKAIQDIESQLTRLGNDGVLRGEKSVLEHLQLIEEVETLEECVKDALLVQECVTENVELKTKIFQEIDKYISPNAILASSSSSIAPSLFTAGLKHKENCLVNHPINPLYIIRLVEIIPAPWTSSEIIKETKELMENLGQKPVVFKKEIPGFGVNRIQLSILNECWQLVKHGYLSAEDVDTLMTEGLGMRYAWQGPIETVHLLADGIENSIRHFGGSFNVIGGTFDTPPCWDLEASRPIIHQMNDLVPLDQLQERRVWRDERLVALAKLKNEYRRKI